MDTYELETRIPVHNHGYVALFKVLGDDAWIEYTARMSYDQKGRTSDTRGLLRYLLRGRHTGPFEQGVMTFEVKMPIFIARQWIRHRTASVNEMSARYTQLPREMFIPVEFSAQAKSNKQGRAKPFSEAMQTLLHDYMDLSNEQSYDDYEYLVSKGVARETAREVLNLNIYTKFIWKMDVHNLMHFLDLRLDVHAQQEIRDYATILEDLMRIHFPLTHEAFVDYVRESYTCSRMEVAVLRRAINEIGQSREGEEPMDEEERRSIVIGWVQDSDMSKREAAAFVATFLDPREE